MDRNFPYAKHGSLNCCRDNCWEICCKFGVPSSIHSDQRRQYESELFSEMCRVLHKKKTRTTSYHSQSDGIVNRFHKTLVTMLSACVNEHHSDWDKFLPLVIKAYRASKHETTGLTPNYTMVGREISKRPDLMFEMPTTVKFIPYNKWASQLKETLEKVCPREHQYIMIRQSDIMIRSSPGNCKRSSKMTVWMSTFAGSRTFT